MSKNKQKKFFQHMVYNPRNLFTMIAEVMKMREEEKNRPSQDSSLQRLFKKRWVFPAVYIASAAIILTGVLWYQSDNANDKIDNSATDLSGRQMNEQPAVEVNRLMENFIMPVKNPDSVVIKTPFYEYDGKKAEQEASLVVYNNSYHPNTGIDITMEDGKAFEVVAALSGTVTSVTEDVLLGNVIEIEHDKGIVTQYQSVKDIMIEIGDTVEQGQTLAKAGQSLYNEAAGTHLHFEIRKDNVPVNPSNFINKPLSALQESTTVHESTEDDGKSVDDEKAKEEEKGAAEDKKTSEDKGSTDEKSPAEDKKPTNDSGSEKDGGQKSDEDGNKTDDNKQNSSPSANMNS
jgi:stage II sporulation protein Q